jgi:integrase
MASDKGLTIATIEKALRDSIEGDEEWLTDASKARGVGRLRFRATKGHGAFYFRYSDSDGKQVPHKLGTYDAKGVDGLTLKDARAKAGELSKLYQGGRRNLREYLDHINAEEQARIETAARARAEAERQATSGTLRNLIDGYIAHLERKRKQSAQDARNILRRNVIDAHPVLAVMRAADITAEDVSKMMAELINRGAGRTATKLRSYLRAAYANALAAKFDSTVHPDLHGFNLSRNPAALVPTRQLAVFNCARERVLNEAELRLLLKELAKQSGTAVDTVMLSLYLGGQRGAQLVRLTPQDVDIVARELTLYDTKGSRPTPRVHLLPLTERAAAIVQRLLDTNGEKPYLITLNGKVPVRTETLSRVVTDISASLLERKKISKPFELRDLRRTAETMMARLRISKDIRAQVQSHGLGGIQARHYDKHDYIDEKREALQTWCNYLDEVAGGDVPKNVVQLRVGAAK